MTPTFSANTQAILLLTAPLIVGRNTPSPDLLGAGEYKRLARHLREIDRQPIDLLGPDSADLLRDCEPVAEEDRLRRLLGRGFLLSQAIDHWQTRAIWVISRADAGYPRRLKARLREDAPALLYGCGDTGLLQNGGLAVVGSRHVDDALIDYTLSIGRLAALAGRTIVSGGAKGIDQAAMRGALEAGGQAIGVLADSLEREAMQREHRDPLLAGQLTLISPYDPNAGFNPGHAMQRNKLIYALADGSFVASSDVNKGGTWAGAVEQLDKYRFVPVYVRSQGAPSHGLDALVEKGALAWPNPRDVDSFEAVFEAVIPTPPESDQGGLPLLARAAHGRSSEAVAESKEPYAPSSREDGQTRASLGDTNTLADILFAAAREAIKPLLNTPKTDSEVAAALDVTIAQAKAWLERLISEGDVEMQKKPKGYILKSKQLF